MYLKEVIELIRDSEPVMKDPEGVAENIMAAIGQKPHRKIVPLYLLQRILAAASVALLLLFGAEQYMIVENVSRLELQLSKAGPGPRYPDPLQMVPAGGLVKAGLSASVINRLLSTRNIKAPVGLELIKKQLETNSIK